MKLFVFIAILAMAVTVEAQSGRVAPQASPHEPSSSAEIPVRSLFDEVNSYNKAKFAEYEQKKIAYSEALRLQTEREQKQLAAKYAAAAGVRANLSAENHYYIGLLHWIAENFDRTSESLRKYLVSPEPSAD
ncbi:MAG: hypothetical protein AAB288_12655, partial [Acidobacteriota bacterium]